MNTANLFVRLEGYARENFTTETLAYILQTDHKVSRKFLELLLRQRKTLLEAFGDYDVGTQVYHNNIGFIDLEITSKRPSCSKIHIEIKTHSPQGKGQIQKYLERLPGHVAYLTPLGYKDPSVQDTHDKYLRHFFWDEVHSIIKNANRNNKLHTQFLEYLEARHMGSPLSITEKELGAAAYAVEFLKKSQALVDAVREEIELPYWKGKFGPNVGGKRPSDETRSGEFHSWWYRSRSWRKKGGRFYLCIGIGFDGDRKQRPKFYVGLGSPQGWLGRSLPSAKHFHKLHDECGWEKEIDTTEREWCYRKFFPLEDGKIDVLASTQANNVRSATKELQKFKIIEWMEKRI